MRRDLDRLARAAGAVNVNVGISISIMDEDLQ